ncbi:MAG: hypothetical protein ACYDDV_04465 [Methanoregula sp.]
MLDKDVVNSLLSEVPSVVFDAIAPLSNKNSQVIFIALLKNEQMRFGDIKQLFHIKNSEEINHPLKSLVKAGLVSKKAEYLDDIGDSEIAVYCPTFMGKSMMRSLYKGVMGASEKISHPQSQIKAINLSGGIVGYTSYAKMNIHEKNYPFNPSKIEYQRIPVAVGGR